MKEIDKYKFIYSNREIYKKYGRNNNGKSSFPLIQLLNPQSLIDVGCGHNDFCKMIIEKININAIGVDFACESADIVCDALNLPFENKSFDLLTCFDMLEHLLPEQVDDCLKEFQRVSYKFVFSICYRPSFKTCFGLNLHPTVENEDWWIDKISKFGGHNIQKYKKFIYGYWKE